MREWKRGRWLLLFVGVLALIAVTILVFVNASPTINPPAQKETAQIVKLPVVETGLYEISLKELREFNPSLESLESESIHLSEGGKQVPYFLDGDTLYFYGIAPEGRYVPSRTYILSMKAAGILMKSESIQGKDTASIENISNSVHLEQNTIYDGRSMSANDLDLAATDPWFWTTIQSDGQVTVDFELANVNNESGALMRASLYGATSIDSVDPDHDLRFWVNGALVGSVAWDGETRTLTESRIDPGILHSGANVLMIDNHQIDEQNEQLETSANNQYETNVLDIIRLDWLEIEYEQLPVASGDQVLLDRIEGAVSVDGFSDVPWVIDITDPHQPTQLSNWQYDRGRLDLYSNREAVILATGPEGLKRAQSISPVRDSNWQNRSNQADLIILSTDELSPELAPLAERRREQGLAVAVVSVDDIYNEFGHGDTSPDAIASFVRYAVSEWSDPKPAYLLLVGEASYDYKDYLANGHRNMIPAPMVHVEYGGETVSDASLADIDSDGIPEISVGRWPVSEPDQVADLVERTIAYEQGDLVDRVLFAADGTSDEFVSLSEEVIRGSALGDDTVERIYGATSKQFTEAWEEGAWLVTYSGHGSIDRWGKDDVFSQEAVSDLRSTGSPPIVLQLTCLTGFYAHPSVDSISESMLRHREGPVLLIAATSLTLSSSQRPFGENFINALQNGEIVRVGDALVLAKSELNVEDHPDLREINDTFALLGDPSALIVKPDR